jgi:hypothetical protein
MVGLQLMFITTLIVVLIDYDFDILKTYYHKKLAPTNSGLSKKEIENRVSNYVQDTKRTMNNELVDLRKQKQLYFKKYDLTSKAYYKIYLAYNTFTMELRPGYYSSIEGGDYLICIKKNKA